MEKDPGVKIRNELQELDALIIEVLESNFLSDKSYTKITAKIGHIDDVYRKPGFIIPDEKYHDWVKNRLDKICKLFINLEKHGSLSLTTNHEDLMHPSGDYYNEDNSISLTDDIKSEISKILNEKY